jgi:hypothetical protein
MDSHFSTVDRPFIVQISSSDSYSPCFIEEEVYDIDSFAFARKSPDNLNADAYDALVRHPPGLVGAIYRTGFPEVRRLLTLCILIRQSLTATILSCIGRTVLLCPYPQHLLY